MRRHEMGFGKLRWLATGLAVLLLAPPATALRFAAPVATTAVAQSEEDTGALNKALDSTATQWSFQVSRSCRE